MNNPLFLCLKILIIVKRDFLRSRKDKYSLSKLLAIKYKLVYNHSCIVGGIYNGKEN